MNETNTTTAINIDEITAPVVAAAEEFPTQLQATLLIYDIPESSRYPNPSGRLRRIGFRENKSCWVIPQGAIPHHLINEMRVVGKANVELIRFDVSEGPRLCRLAVDRIKREVAEAVTRMQESMARAEQSHLEALDNDPELRDNQSAREAAIKRYETQCKDAIKRVQTLCKDVEVAIKNFGVRPELLQLGDAQKAMEVLQTGYRNRSAVYAAATAALREINTPDAQALAAAAEQDAVPAAVIADMLKDHDKGQQADELVAAFSDEIGVVSDEPETFSLADFLGDEPTDEELAEMAQYEMPEE